MGDNKRDTLAVAYVDSPLQESVLQVYDTLVKTSSSIPFPFDEFGYNTINSVDIGQLTKQLLKNQCSLHSIQEDAARTLLEELTVQLNQKIKNVLSNKELNATRKFNAWNEQVLGLLNRTDNLINAFAESDLAQDNDLVCLVPAAFKNSRFASLLRRFNKKNTPSVQDLLHTYCSPWWPVMERARLLFAHYNKKDGEHDYEGHSVLFCPFEEETHLPPRHFFQRAAIIGMRLEALHSSEQFDPATISWKLNISRSKLAYILRKRGISSTSELVECLTLKLPKNYVVYQKLGSGKVSDVYAAYNRITRKHVALKIIKTEIPSTHRRKFGVNTPNLPNHQNIAKQYEAFESDGKWVISMELFEKTLRQRMNECAPGGIPLEEILVYDRQIRSGLDAVHKKGVVHPDLTPDNIGITKEKVIKITDFNPSLYTDTMQEKHGPIDYLSPNPLLAVQQGTTYKLEPKDNWWALGVILYELFTGVNLFSPPQGKINKQFQRDRYRAYLINAQEKFKKKEYALPFPKSGYLTYRIGHFFLDRTRELFNIYFNVKEGVDIGDLLSFLTYR